MRRSRWYHRRDVRFLIFVAVVIALYIGQGYVFGPARISDALSAAMRGNNDRMDIVVTTRFPAEEFHFGIFQRLGSIRGATGDDLTVFAVRQGDVRMLSRKYWVEIINLAPHD